MPKNRHAPVRPRGFIRREPTQQVPLALRRRIWLRDQHCVVPGCRHSQCDLHTSSFERMEVSIVSEVSA